MTLHWISEDAGEKTGSNVRITHFRCDKRCGCVDLEWRVLVAVHQDWLTADLILLFIFIFRIKQHVDQQHSLSSVIDALMMFPKTSFTSLIVGVFLLYVLHTCWVMYGIVYTKPCEKPKTDNCISPYLAGNPRLQVRLSCAAVISECLQLFF